MSEPVGLIVIGRNEGEQLRRCFASTAGKFVTTVYVDSGSTDGSCELARSMGVEVINLDMTKPFTAARARNSGVDRLMQLQPNLTFIHTLDGDVEMIDGWLESAIEVMKQNPKAAVLSGLRIEKYPERSPYIRLCNIEWNKPDGYRACEGDAILRVEAFRKVGGFNEKLIAGEEPELCLRFWQAGYQCLRNRVPMSRHDVGLVHFSQWWRREMRAGFSYAEGSAMYGRLHYLRQSMGIWFWALAVPLAGVAAAYWTRGLSVLLALALYGLLFYRSYKGIRARAQSNALAREYAFFNVLGKFSMLSGMFQYWYRRGTGKQARIIEYRKAPAAPGFTLIEMLVVIGIIGILIALLLPALQRAKAQSNQVVCMSNERQIAIEMLTYASYNNGYLFTPNKGYDPTGQNIIAGTNPAQFDVWPYYVFDPHIWDPRVMICPSDVEPVGDHSYLANAHLLPVSMPNTLAAGEGGANYDIKFGSPLPTGETSSTVIVLGEKVSSLGDYYMDPGDFSTRVEQYRHGLSVGSNYLMLDMHVETIVPADAVNGLDPWSVVPPTSPPTNLD
jgi:prepilin-type N-terminal cleavage/methylation domain-containing protein